MIHLLHYYDEYYIPDKDHGFLFFFQFPVIVRHYVKKTNRGRSSYGNEKLKNALQELENRAPLLRVSVVYGIPRRTLRRHMDHTSSQGPYIVTGTIRCHRDHTSSQGQLCGMSWHYFIGTLKQTLPPALENELHRHIQEMERSLYGLSTIDVRVRRLAFELAERAGVSHSFNCDTRIAGKRWLQGFFARYPGLSVRIPQPTSLARAVAFNKPMVDRFYTLYRETLKSIPDNAPSRIWNMDETGITNVHKPQKVIGSKGVRQVRKVTSRERGQTVTLI